MKGISNTTLIMIATSTTDKAICYVPYTNDEYNSLGICSHAKSKLAMISHANINIRRFYILVHLKKPTIAINLVISVRVGKIEADLPTNG